MREEREREENILIPNTERRDMLVFELKYLKLVKSYKNVLESSLQSLKQIVGLKDEF